MKQGKATSAQQRRHNRQLVLRAVYNNAVNNRAALAQETNLTKTTVSDLVGELVSEGFLEEGGFGQSRIVGGKPPRLLKFVPTARQIIGVSLDAGVALGVLARLDGQVVAEHICPLEGAKGQSAFKVLTNVINGLVAQLTAPLMCLGIGVPGLVINGVVQSVPHLGWTGFDLAGALHEQYSVPVHIANSTQLAATAQYAFGGVGVIDSLVTLRVTDSIGVGLVLSDAAYDGGNEIGYFRTAPGITDLESILGWEAVHQRITELVAQFPESPLASLATDDLTYLNIRAALVAGDPAALAFDAELTTSLAQIFSWIIVLLRPGHISLIGSIADMGEPLLERVIEKIKDMVLADMVEAVSFSVDNSTNLVGQGAVALALRQELGLV